MRCVLLVGELLKGSWRTTESILFDSESFIRGLLTDSQEGRNSCGDSYSGVPDAGGIIPVVSPFRTVNIYLSPVSSQQVFKCLHIFV